MIFYLKFLNTSPLTYIQYCQYNTLEEAVF